MQPVQVARLLAAPAVAAADRGSVDVVATVVQLLFGSRMQPLLVWLLVEMVEGMDRPDAAAAAALACLQEEGGAGDQGRGRHGEGEQALCICMAGGGRLVIAAAMHGPTAAMRDCLPCAVLVGDLAALLAADGHHRTAAGLAHALYDGACSLALEQVQLGSCCGMPAHLRCTDCAFWAGPR